MGKNYFSLSGQDAVNNYYIYSAGNVTYTSAGHSDMDKEGTDAEMELFVNTFVRAILAGNSEPQVSYTDAVYDDTQKAYSSYIKYNQVHLRLNLVWNIRLIISGVCQGQMMHH